MNLPSSPTPADTVQELLEVLDLKPAGPDRFTVQPKHFGRSRIYGGQIFAQALVAAHLTTGERMPHSLHACFLRPGSPDAPVSFEVERLLDGGAFSNRSVKAVQGGAVILTLIASFHRAETGFDHQAPAPDAPSPEALACTAQLLKDWTEQSGETPHAMLESSMTDRMGLEVRPVDPASLFVAFQGPPQYAHWVRVRRQVSDDPRLHCWLLAFASDLGFIGTSLRPHGQPWYSPILQPSTITHSLWFHRPFRADEWLLYVMDSPSAYGARGLVRGSLYDRNGRLVASAAQDGLIRPIRPAAST